MTLYLKRSKRFYPRLSFLLLILWVTHPTKAQDIQSPRQFFGYELGADARIPNWSQILNYYKHLSQTSSRVQFEIVGESMQKRPMIMLKISSSDNLAHLEDIRKIQLKLADARTVRTEELQELISRGRSVLLCYIAEADHTAAWLAQIIFVHELATSDKAEIGHWLDNTVLLFMPSLNPDGIDYTYSWVEKTRGTQWEGSNPPELPSFYGEPNRDWHTFSMKEYRVVTDVMKRWQPNAVHDIHTMGTQPRAGVRMFVPPYLPPMEPNMHPLIWHLQSEMGMAMAGRLIERDLAGVTFGSIYDLWNPARGYAQHHHTLRILTESSPPKLTAATRWRFEDLKPDNRVETRSPSVNFPLVWTGGDWGNKQIIPYITTALEAEVDHLAINRERYLRTKYKVAKEFIERKEAPYAFLVPMQQYDLSSMREMLSMLSFGEIEIYRATSSFKADGIDHSKGTYVIPLNQPFGNWAKAMLEPQVYPEVRDYPGGPILAPYDTVAFSYPYALGVRVISVNSPLNIPTERVTEFPASGGSVIGRAVRGYYLLSHNQNASLKALGRLLSENVLVGWAKEEFISRGHQWPAGTIIITAGPGTYEKLSRLASEFGLEFVTHEGEIKVPLINLRLPRVAVYRPHVGGRNGYGYARLLLPEYSIPFEVLTDNDIRSGKLRGGFDALVLPSYTTPKQFMDGYAPGTYLPEMTGGLGRTGVERLKEFVDSGGTILAVDQSNDFIIEQLGLPVSNIAGTTVGMFARDPSGATSDTKFDLVVPGSFLRMTADLKHPIAYGMPAEFSAMFNRGQAFEVKGPDALIIARFPFSNLLLSGLAVGTEKLYGKGGVVEVRKGTGRVVLFGIRPEMRLQTRGTYKLFLNTLYLSAAK